MKSNGSIYVSVVVAALVAYFSYQWWFNPHRVVKRRLGEIAATLSVPESEAGLERVARVAELRRCLADDVHVRVARSGGDVELLSRDEVLAAVGGWTPPPGGWNVDFVDVDVAVDSGTTARAYLTADMTSRDPRTGERTLDSRDATVSMVNRDGEWVVSEVDVKEPPTPPSRP
jgi:hypothetical protein